mmetsp:Transcript_8396/g.19766  ORF Transcript_8396/g.19766 Transcript_8396/m.19766 type:complete len:215 (+) Transcript_8396:251-895(+)
MRQNTFPSLKNVVQLIHNGLLQACICDVVLPEMRLSLPRSAAGSRLYLPPLLFVLFQVGLHCLPVVRAHLQTPHAVQTFHDADRILHEPFILHMHWLGTTAFSLSFVHGSHTGSEGLGKRVQDMSTNAWLIHWSCGNCLVLRLPHATEGRHDILGISVCPYHAGARKRCLKSLQVPEVHLLAFQHEVLARGAAQCLLVPEHVRVTLIGRHSLRT